MRFLHSIGGRLATARPSILVLKLPQPRSCCCFGTGKLFTISGLASVQRCVLYRDFPVIRSFTDGAASDPRL